MYNKEYKTAIIGAGFIGEVHVEAIRRLGNVEILALCDSFDVEKKAKALNIPNSYNDYHKMFDELNLDVVHICTPNNTHYDIAKAAIEKGINFICEKPFTTTIEQAQELVKLAKEKGVTGAVNFHNRFYPMANHAREMVKAGELGDVFTIHGSYIQDWLLYDTDYSWRLNKAQVGNTRAVADIGSHWMDLAEFITGLKIQKVSAKFSTVYPIRKKPIGNIKTLSPTNQDVQYEEIKIDTEDAATVLLEFENGAIGSLVVSQVFAGKKNATTICVGGNKCSIIWDTEKLNDLYIGYRDEANKLLTKDASLMYKVSAGLASYPGGHIEGFPDAFKQAFRQFYYSIHNDGEYNYATLEDGLRGMQLCESIYNSAMTQQWITV